MIDVDILIKQNAQLVESLVDRVSKKYNIRTCDKEDLKQEADIALYLATKSFDAERNVQFSTYAYNKIEIALKKWISNNYYPCQLTNYRKKQLKEYKKVVEEYQRKNAGNDPPDKFITQAMGINEKQLKNIREALESQKIYSLDALEDENYTEIFSMEESVEKQVIDNLQHEELRNCILKLNKLEQQVIIAKYFRTMREKEIANKFGISVARVSAICSHALNKLKEMCKKQYFK